MPDIKIRLVVERYRAQMNRIRLRAAAMIRGLYRLDVPRLLTIGRPNECERVRKALRTAHRVERFTAPRPAFEIVEFQWKTVDIEVRLFGTRPLAGLDFKCEGV